MRKFNKLLFLLFLLSFEVYSQRFNTLGDDEKYIDSLRSSIFNSIDDSLKSINSFKLADLYRRNKNIPQFEKFLRIGNQYKTRFPYLVDCSRYYNAQQYLVKNDLASYSKNILLTLDKLKKYQSKESYELQSVIYQNLSIIKRIEDNEKGSMNYLVNHAIVTAKKSQNPEIIGDIYKHIGIALMNNGNRAKANDYYLNSILNFEKASNKSPLLKESKVEVYLITAENYAYLEIPTLSQKYLNKAYQILKDFPKSNLNGMYYFSNGINLYKQSKFESAIESYNKGIVNCLENNDVLSLNRLKFVKYQSLIELGKLNEANLILIDLIENGNLMIEDKKNYFREIAISYQKTKNYKDAVDYALKYIKLNDSLIENGIKKEILALETKFNTTEKERKILKLENEKIEKEIRLKNLRLWYGFVSITLVVLVILFYFLFKNFKIQKKLIKQQNIIHSQNVDFLNSQRKIEVMQAMNKGEESERKRIARDLHDGIGSRLSSLKMQLENLDSNSSSYIDYKKFSINLGLAIKDLRNTAFNLIPETLYKLGLELAIKDLCFSMSNNNVTIHFTSNEIQSNIIESNQITIFRIVQELINNSLKHSNCTEIIVDCSQNGELFLITVEDNGIGFNTNDIDCFAGLGLRNIKSRVELLKGKIDVVSNFCKGTIFNIELKVQFENGKKI